MGERSHPLQAQTRLRRHHNPHRWFQRRDCDLQEHEIQRMGRWWTGQDSTAMETLLLWHAGFNMGYRQQ